jgi:hypothetical protein
MVPAAAPVGVAAASRQDLRAVARALGIGLGLTLLQVLLGCFLSGRSDLHQAHLQLCYADSSWYGSIIDKGYFCPPVMRPRSFGNVAFFPAYPLSAWLIQWATAWTTMTSLLAAAHLASWGFWTYLLLLLQRWRVSLPLAALAVLLVASRPGAFYLAAGYSEALFLMNLAGFLYWIHRRSHAALCLAALHGAVLTATRLVGLAIVIYPLLDAWLNAAGGERPTLRQTLGRWLPPLAVAAVACLGAALFFLYCQLRFGQWNLYMKTQTFGWGVQLKWLAFFSPNTYFIHSPTMRDGFLDPDWFNRLGVLVTLSLFVGLFIVELCLARRRLDTGWRARVGVYVVAFLIWFINVSAMSSIYMTSMLRHVLPTEVLLGMAFAHLLARTALPAGGRRWLGVGLAVWVMVGLVFQIAYLYRFTHALWVA